MEQGTVEARTSRVMATVDKAFSLVSLCSRHRELYMQLIRQSLWLISLSRLWFQQWHHSRVFRVRCSQLHQEHRTREP